MEPICRILIHDPIIGLNGKTYMCIFKYSFYFENDSILNRFNSHFSENEPEWWVFDRGKNLLVSRSFNEYENIEELSINNAGYPMISFSLGRAKIDTGGNSGEYCSECGQKTDYNKQKYCKSCGNELMFFSGNINYPVDFLFPPEEELHKMLKKYKWYRDPKTLKIDSYPVNINNSKDVIETVILELAKLDKRCFDAFRSRTKSPFVISLLRLSSTKITFVIVSTEKVSVDLYLDKVDGTTLIATNVNDSFEVQEYKASIGERLYIRAKIKHKNISDSLEFDLT